MTPIGSTMPEMSEDYQRVAQAIRFVEDNFQDQPELKRIAAHIGLSEYHFQRVFKRWVGISPKRFLQYVTADYARHLLQQHQQNVLDTSYAVGLSGPGRLHDLTVNIHAMTPGELRDQGAGLVIRYGCHPSPFGDAIIAMTERGVCGLGFIDEIYDRTAAFEGLKANWPNATYIQDDDATAALMPRIFASGRGADEAIALHVKGTNFQVRVWEALLNTAPGSVTTYGDIAAALDAPTAARAVGGAVGRNPVAYLIPCHRVIRKSGTFGGYHWGTTRKKAMLAWEAAQHIAPLHDVYSSG